MPIEYLKVIAVETLPMDVDDEACIDKLRVLEAAGMVEAVFIPEPRAFVRVIAVTGLGRASLLADTARRVIIKQRNAEVSSAWAALS